jgi:hypothetical protein
MRRLFWGITKKKKKRSLKHAWLFVSLFIAMLLCGCQVARPLTQSLPIPQSDRAEVVTSPSGRFQAQLWRCCDFLYNYISGFAVYDTLAGQLRWQAITGHIEGTHPTLAGGVFFEWTPSEHYLVVVTDDAVTSHGCDALVVYSGDGAALVYNGAPTNPCNTLGLGPVDSDVRVVALCANDDVLFVEHGGYFRLTPASGVVTENPSQGCDSSED